MLRKQLIKNRINCFILRLDFKKTYRHTKISVLQYKVQTNSDKMWNLQQ